MGERQADYAKYERSDRRESQRECKRLPEWGSETEERGSGIGQGSRGGVVIFNAEGYRLNAE